MTRTARRRMCESRPKGLNDFEVSVHKTADLHYFRGLTFAPSLPHRFPGEPIVVTQCTSVSSRFRRRAAGSSLNVRVSVPGCPLTVGCAL
ncbi:hypothetical protein NDU88_007893 [Pleurodeles waltl]|uniref:Uncharacterized protein n=1 Tax=Pleurodeles waltl TaxID=8319 RepID=A0AAV7QR30_PLEWA|nr:hypothetical protein NDU88_007893 [Pleurodeles waltl]